MKKNAYYFSQEDNILATDDKDTSWYVSIFLPRMYSFNGLVHYEIGELIYATKNPY